MEVHRAAATSRTPILHLTSWWWQCHSVGENLSGRDRETLQKPNTEMSFKKISFRILKTTETTLEWQSHPTKP